MAFNWPQNPTYFRETTAGVTGEGDTLRQIPHKGEIGVYFRRLSIFWSSVAPRGGPALSPCAHIPHVALNYTQRQTGDGKTFALAAK